MTEKLYTKGDMEDTRITGFTTGVIVGVTLTVLSVIILLNAPKAIEKVKIYFCDNSYSSSGIEEPNFPHWCTKKAAG